MQGAVRPERGSLESRCHHGNAPHGRPPAQYAGATTPPSLTGPHSPPPPPPPPNPHPPNQWRINNTQGELTDNAPFINAVLDGTYVRELKQDSLLEFDDSELWDPVSEPAKRLVEKTMVADPRLRASPAEILADPWISENAAPITPLPNVLGRLQKLKLDGLQKLMLRVMSQKTENDALLLEAQHLFAELDVEQRGLVRKVDLAGLLRTQSGTSVYRAHVSRVRGRRAHVRGEGRKAGWQHEKLPTT